MRESRNLMPNPKPANAKHWNGIGASMSFDGQGMRLEGTTSNSYAVSSLTSLAAGDYVAVATLVSASNDSTGFPRGNCMLVGLHHNNGGLDYKVAKYAGTGQQYIVRFTVSEGNTKRIADVILHSPLPGDAASNACRWVRVGVFTASDWDAMQEKGVEWFDGDNYQRNNGGGAIS